jgi:hypothetical protein
MTFDEWYKENYPGDYSLAVLAKSPPALEKYEQAKDAWDTAYGKGWNDRHHTC